MLKLIGLIFCFVADKKGCQCITMGTQKIIRSVTGESLIIVSYFYYIAPINR